MRNPIPAEFSDTCHGAILGSSQPERKGAGSNPQLKRLQHNISAGITGQDSWRPCERVLSFFMTLWHLLRHRGRESSCVLAANTKRFVGRTAVGHRSGKICNQDRPRASQTGFCSRRKSLQPVPESGANIGPPLRQRAPPGGALQNCSSAHFATVGEVRIIAEVTQPRSKRRFC